MKIVITGSGGLLGHHAAVRLHAANCAARFRQEAEPFDIVRLDHSRFMNDAQIDTALSGASAVLHFAGVNRASETEILLGNPDIARRLATCCARSDIMPHIVYANSTHSAGSSTYGQSKRIASEILSDIGGRYTDMVLPHIFGEGARANYNNVTATFIACAVAGDAPQIDPAGRVQLLHAGTAAQIAIDVVLQQEIGRIEPAGRAMAVRDLWAQIRHFHASYSGGLFPAISDPFDLALFNSYRAALYPANYPIALKLNCDARGHLFEAVKGGGGGQTFLSTTHPGVTRGDHFHIEKIERFLVLEGDAMIRIRPVLGESVWECRVSGKTPAAVDMPTLHTHSIENIGDTPLLTMFWANAEFDPASPDTYADPVLGAG